MEVEHSDEPAYDRSSGSNGEWEGVEHGLGIERLWVAGNVNARGVGAIIFNTGADCSAVEFVFKTNARVDVSYQKHAQYATGHTVRLGVASALSGHDA